MAGLRNYTLLLAAGQEMTISVPDSNIVNCYDGVAPFTIKPDGNDPVELQKGVGMTFESRFNSLTIANTSAASQTVKLYVGAGEIRDNRLVAQGGISVSGSPVATLIVAAVTGTAALIEPQNSNRVQVMIVNTGAALCYIGLTAGVTAANGLPLSAGASLNLTCQSAIYAISNGTNTELRVLEEAVA